MQVSAQSKRADDSRLSTHDFHAALSALGPFESAPHLAVALSGGSDSMALTLLADAWVRARGGRLTALIVDHRLRAESASEARQVAEWMRLGNIDCEILTPLHHTAGNNVMQAARQWRYDALAEWCRAHDLLHCLLGHHAGDQRETVALHQARGETEDGPSGMRSVRNYRGVRFLRPLLGFEKETLRDFLREQAAQWIEDPTNADQRFARARLRKTAAALPLPSTAERARREQEVARAAAQCVTIFPNGTATLDRARWMALEEPIGTQLLADLLRSIGSDTSRPRKHKTLRLAETLRGARTTKCTLAGCLVETEDYIITIGREAKRGDGGFCPPKPLAESPFW